MYFKQIVNSTGNFIVKNSPYILSGIGGASIIAGTIIAIKKSRKAIDTIDKKEEARIVNGNESRDGETNKEYAKRRKKVYIKVALDYSKYYSLPVVLISGGILCMLSSTMIQTKRLKVMSAAYTSLATAFASYRDRVKKAVGEEKENDIFHNIKRNENGEIISSKECRDNYEKEQNDVVFSKLFGDGYTPYWSKDTRLCVLHVLGAEGVLNSNLKEKGFITLNEVYSELGFEHTEEGMYLGWRYIPNDPIYGTTYIDLGLCGDKYRDRREKLNHEYNQEFWIDFIPPHNLFGKVKKEKVRTREEKVRILNKRRGIHA